MTQTIMITGASSGLGRATAIYFADKGWQVAATMRNPEKEKELAMDPQIQLFQLDVTSTDSVNQAVQDIHQKFTTIDVLVNSAGFGATGAFETTTDAEIAAQFEVNTFGAMRVTHAVLPIMRTQHSGTILNISSFGGVVGQAFGTLYASSKFALEGFSEALSHEVAFLGIKVALIEPGSVETGFRSSMMMGKNDIPAYTERLSEMMPKFIARSSSFDKASTEDVAQTIYQAATDGKTQLRYVVGDDAQYYIDLKNGPEETLIEALR